MRCDLLEYVKEYRTYKGRLEMRGDILLDTFIQCGSIPVVNRPKFKGKTQRHDTFFFGGILKKRCWTLL